MSGTYQICQKLMEAAKGQAETKKTASAKEKLAIKVLIVDDKLLNQKLLAKHLSGCSIISANNGGEAVTFFTEAAESSPFDIVFMDLEMPIMDGHEATKILRSIPEGKNTPIICVSTLVNREEELRCITEGMNDFLPKPIDKKRVQKLMDKYFPPESAVVSVEDKAHVAEEKAVDSLGLETPHKGLFFNAVSEPLPVPSASFKALYIEPSSPPTLASFGLTAGSPVDRNSATQALIMDEAPILGCA